MKVNGKVWATALLVCFLIASGTLISRSGSTKEKAGGDGKVPDELLFDPTCPAKGPNDAKAVIVEFSDFQCPYCARMAKIAESYWKAAPEEVRLVWMDRPLTTTMPDAFAFHPYSMTAHEAAAEAQEQGKFWEFQAWVFENQEDLFPHGRPGSVQNLENQIKTIRKKILEACPSLGLDKEKMEKALSEGVHSEKIKKRVEMGKDLGVDGTPTFYVNGTMTGYSDASLKAAVEKAIGKKLEIERPEDK